MSGDSAVQVSLRALNGPGIFLPCRRLRPGQHRLLCGHLVVAPVDKDDNSQCAKNCGMTVAETHKQFLCTECLENDFYSCSWDRKEIKELSLMSEDEAREMCRKYVRRGRKLLCIERGNSIETRKPGEVEENDKNLSEMMGDMCLDADLVEFLRSLGLE